MILFALFGAVFLFILLRSGDSYSEVGMAYKSIFEIKASGNVMKAMSEESENGRSVLGGEPLPWYGYKFSRKFPGELITVTRYGEDPNDYERSYFRGGREQHCKAKITYPECMI